MNIKLYKVLLVFIGTVLGSQMMSARGTALSSLTVVDDSVYQAALDQELAVIFQGLFNDYQGYFDQFQTSISIQAASVGDFSINKVDDYKTSVADEIDAFKLNCKIADDKALLLYYNFLSAQGRESTGAIDSVAQKMNAAMTTIKEYFANKITLMMVELFNNKPLAEMTASLSGAISSFNQQTIANFEASQKIASTMYTKTGWESFVSSLDKFMKVLAPQLAIDVGTALIKEVGKIAENGAKLLTDSFKKESTKKDEKSETSERMQKKKGMLHLLKNLQLRHLLKKQQLQLHLLKK